MTKTAESLQSLEITNSASALRPYLLAMPGSRSQLLAASLSSILECVDIGSYLASTAEAQPVNDLLRHYLVLVSAPEDVVAEAIESHTDADDALTKWFGIARRLAAWRLRSPSRYTFIDVSDAIASPVALTSLLSQHVASAAASELPTPHAETPDPLAALIAEARVLDHPQIHRLAQEMKAHCTKINCTELDHETRSRAAISRYYQLVNELTAQYSRIDDLSSNVELHKLLIAQAQEELDQLYKRSATTSEAILTPSATARSLRILDSSLHPPFRHIHIELRDVRFFDRYWSTLEVRLVSHYGRPGVAFFSHGASSCVVSAWTPTGREGSRDFMLIVPNDLSARQLLAAFGTTDWQNTMAIVQLVAHLLARESSDLASDWLPVALRLERQLSGLPQKPRCDSCDIEQAVASEGAVRLHLRNVLHEQQSLGDMVIEWHPERGLVEWLAPPRGQPLPLNAWPVDDMGFPKAVLAWSTNSPQTDQRKLWNSLSAPDRGLLLYAIESIGIAASRDPALSVVSSKANSLLIAARRTLRSIDRRRLIRRTLRRLHLMH